MLRSSLRNVVTRACACIRLPGPDVEDEAGRDDEESGEEESGSEQASDGDPDGGLPPLQSSSGSEAETAPTPKRSNKNASAKGKPAAKPAKPSAAAARQAAAKSPGEDQRLWTQFARYRSGLTSTDRMGLLELKQWEALAKEDLLPREYVTWYADVVRAYVRRAQRGGRRGGGYIMLKRAVAFNKSNWG